MTRVSVAVFFAAALFHTPLLATNVSIPASDDAPILWIENSPGTAAGSYGVNSLNQAGAFDGHTNTKTRSLFKFILPPIGAGESIQNASLKLGLMNQSGALLFTYKNFDFYRIDDNWSETTVLWLNAPQPAQNQQPVLSFNAKIIDGHAIQTFDVTSAVMAEIATESSPVLSLLLKERDETGICCNRIIIDSKDVQTIGVVPQVILTIVPEPSTILLALAALTGLPVRRHS